VDIVLLWLALLATVVAFWKVRPLAGALLVPYLAWVTFASALNFAIWRLNR
jgi:tryptophan-rich sensory protein